MAEDRRLELPEHVVDKIQKVLGIAPSALAEHEAVHLIEDLCDTALMFEREERGADRTDEEERPSGAGAGAGATQPVERPAADD